MSRVRRKRPEVQPAEHAGQADARREGRQDGDSADGGGGVGRRNSRLRGFLRRKTSLALTLAVHALSDFPDGVFGVRLASLDTAHQVPVAVADALGMPMDGAAAEGDIRERLYSYLANRRLLLLLDNCEPVVDAAAGLADHILGRCADVTILSTSREALAVPDEVQVNVGPLAVPPKTPATVRADQDGEQDDHHHVRLQAVAQPDQIAGEEDLLTAYPLGC